MKRHAIAGSLNELLGRVGIIVNVIQNPLILLSFLIQADRYLPIAHCDSSHERAVFNNRIIIMNEDHHYVGWIYILLFTPRTEHLCAD